ncbi:hypothetical protein A3J19_02955 [Candidatus Daviesbacteria bacterium RIFCSPLOWO2_02_FULL_41_8]|uniref:DUF5615 domain-containing protein n=2 Tax=Candidatus Daviesiibacteriota TaxID=1752718 RepID=A0A1F5NHR2_9BACT|nr:MAG: hypothetical protein A3D83_03415 [Candidatus Daviesbacteria bacterium RIFCSPHIGHO2_02_FULL_41_10]OGE77226.1 MAG: hypothetical protein A3J19_02955 [Candidatus Daviesbacteria bacterium RIFCSPLOWO2_02_FULL_41_8]
MKFLLDENIGKKVAYFLQSLDHIVLRIRQINPGIPDYQVLRLAVSKESILITSDKDFGELIFKEKQSSTGVIFLRLQDESSDNKIKALQEVLSKHKEIRNKFITVSEKEGKFVEFVVRVTEIASSLV